MSPTLDMDEVRHVATGEPHWFTTQMARRLLELEAELAALKAGPYSIRACRGGHFHVVSGDATLSSAYGEVEARAEAERLNVEWNIGKDKIEDELAAARRRITELQAATLETATPGNFRQVCTPPTHHFPGDVRRGCQCGAFGPATGSASGQNMRITSVTPCCQWSGTPNCDCPVSATGDQR